MHARILPVQATRRAASRLAALLSALVVLLLLAPVAAAEAPVQAPGELTIVEVRCESQSGVANSPANRCEVHDHLVITVAGLDEWARVDPEHNPDRLTLVLNGSRIDGYDGRRARRTEQGVELRFDLAALRSTALDPKTWKEFLRRSTLLDTRQMSVALSPEDSTERFFARATVFLKVTSREFLIAVSAVFLILVACFFYLVRRSNILRMPGPPLAKPDRRPYSLGRTQMAWWFFVVVASYLYIWLVIGDLNTLTPGVLALIGISAATGFAAATIDTSKVEEVRSKRAAFDAEQASLHTEIAGIEAQLELRPPPANVDELRARLLAKRSRLAVTEQEEALLPVIIQMPSRGLWRDLLCDEHGVSFHRFQIVSWSIVLGVIFARSVWADLSMPEFDASLLGLMGISSGTYVGFKFPESARA
ncbi:MAG: hypothetical protein KC636_30605 [Myxococcales bacterium]|nr:hypothetical protein [Myxococcales bacterium]